VRDFRELATWQITAAPGSPSSTGHAAIVGKREKPYGKFQLDLDHGATLGRMISGPGEGTLGPPGLGEEVCP
jgi:hypothetical protein